jgi:hypothetical protein
MKDPKSSPKKHSRFFYQKLLFPILGTGSLIWFLMRVIPKPSRAAYPCMRVAAPMASTFIMWVLGLGISFQLLKRGKSYFKRSRYFLATGCIVVGGIVGGIFISMPHSPAQAAAPAANAPIGVAKGAVPGRVVWVHDTAVSTWKGLNYGHWWQNAYTNQTVTDRMMSKTLRSLTNKTTDAAAWDTLFRYFNKAHNRGSKGYTAGEKIAVKINLVACNYNPAWCIVDTSTYKLKKELDFMHTSPQVVRSLLRELVNVVGVNQADISIGDPTAYYPAEYYDSVHAEFPNVKFMDHAGKFGRTKYTSSSTPMYWSCRPTGVTQDYVPADYVQATYFINLSTMKSHLGAGITLCAKNLYGSLIRAPAESTYYSLHTSLAYLTPATGSYRAVVDLMGHSQIGGKTLLCLIDGLYSGNHNNDTVPHKWSVAPFNGHWTSSLFASQDPVAIESVLFDLFQLDDDPYQYPKIAGASDYLSEAALANNPPSGTYYDPDHATATTRLASLGVYEHWNNATDRKYSRNLGTGSGIELVFVEGSANAIRWGSAPARNNTGYSMRQLSNTSTIEYSMPINAQIRLNIQDSRGRAAGTILNTFMTAGTHRINLNSAKNKELSPGVYFMALYCDGIQPAAVCKVVVSGIK